jgi:hypothetical protein
MTVRNNPNRVADAMTNNLGLTSDEKQKLLAECQKLHPGGN